MGKVNLADQLVAHRKRREALEQLVTFAKQISVAGDGMEALQFVTKPSQNPEKKRYSFVDKMIEHLEKIESDELQVRLKKIDAQLIKETSSFIKLAGLSEQDYHVRFQARSADEIGADVDALQNRLQNFRRKAQTNVAIRITLHSRGAQLHAIKLPITQEDLSSQLINLRKGELQCKNRIKKEINILIDDTNKVLENTQYPEQLKAKMQEAKTQLESALKHIERGSNIEDLPITIEVHEEEYKLPAGFSEAQSMESKHRQIKSDEMNDKKASLKISSKDNDNTGAVTKKDNGFFHNLKCWMFSPWGVTWKDIKQRNGKR